MVVSRNGSVVHPCIKEAMVPPPTVTGRTVTRRVAELPSLRYGSIGARSSASGPLRVTSHYHSDTLPRAARKSGGISYAADAAAFKPVRPPRRVRFTLPAADGERCVDGVADGGVGGGVIKPTAGDGWLRTRAPATDRSDVLNRRASSDRCYQQLQHHQTIAGSTNTTRFESFNNNNNKSEYNSFYRRNEITYPPPINASVPITPSPGVRTRIHPTGRYIRGTLSPTANATPHAAATPGGHALLRAARDGDDILLRDLLRRASVVGIPETGLNATDNSGRTVLSYVASNGSMDVLEQILQLPGLDVNRPDNEGNTPLHFAAQAGQVECLNCMLSRCRGIEIDVRNNLGFTPLMKAALQGRNKCAKLLLFAGANPTLRDNGRGLRADQWARFCGRYVCADVIEKHARQRLLERSTSYGNWGGENEVGARVLLGKVVPVPPIQAPPSNGIKSKLRKVFRTSSGPTNQHDSLSSARLVTQLTSAALCASSPVLPSAPTVPPVVKSLIRPLTVPRLQITLANNNGEHTNLTNGLSKSQTNISDEKEKAPMIKPVRTKKKK